MSRRRRVAAFLLSPAVGAVVFFVSWLTLLGVGPGGLRLTGTTWKETLEGLALFFGFPLTVGLVAEIVLGWPLLVFLRHRQYLSIGYFATGGLLIGLIIALVLYWEIPVNIPGVVLCVVPAVVASLFFGWVGDWKTPQDSGDAGE